MKIEVFDFAGEWEEAFGHPQRTGLWYIYGASGHGKTSFLLLMMKELSQYGRILFVSYEEQGGSRALQEGIRRTGLVAAANRRVIICSIDKEGLRGRLKKQRSADIVIIDSLDLSEFRTVKHVTDLVMEFERKLFIFTGWARGKEPLKRLGEDILFIANQKIFVEGYRAHSRGRSFGERGYLTIWDEGAKKYWEK
jgi:hypothetical protein